MIVCHCRVISDRAIRAAVSQGARTTAAACQATSAAQGCGSCVFTVKAIVSMANAEDSARLEVGSAAS